MESQDPNMPMTTSVIYNPVVYKTNVIDGNKPVEFNMDYNKINKDLYDEINK